MNAPAKKPTVKSATMLLQTLGNLPPVIPSVPTQLAPGPPKSSTLCSRNSRPSSRLGVRHGQTTKPWMRRSVAGSKRSSPKASTRSSRSGTASRIAETSAATSRPALGSSSSGAGPPPEMLGIPSHDKAYREALDNSHPSRFGERTWSHPAVRHAALQCARSTTSAGPDSGEGQQGFRPGLRHHDSPAGEGAPA